MQEEYKEGDMEYYSDQVNGSQPRDRDDIPPTVRAGIVSLINGLIQTGAFGQHFPEMCQDGAGVCGTDEQSLKHVLQAEIPSIEYPFVIEKEEREWWAAPTHPYAPHHLVILDLIQFCYRRVAKPIQGSHHSYFQHYHLDFDVETGRAEFLENVNRVFKRNGIAYELRNDGSIHRLAPIVLRDSLTSAHFRTPDETLNRLLEEARVKFMSPDDSIRRESLERLWDAWERLKTLLNPEDKRLSVQAMLDRCAREPALRAFLEVEAKCLTEAGNKFHIRHSEIGQVEVELPQQVDYLFHRLFSLISLCIQSMR